MTSKINKQNKDRPGNDLNTHLPDDKNPQFLFSTTHTSLLIEIVKGSINAEKLALKELEKRGLNKNGRWVGFDLDR
jgi:hypothetical protein